MRVVTPSGAAVPCGTGGRRWRHLARTGIGDAGLPDEMDPLCRGCWPGRRAATPAIVTEPCRRAGHDGRQGGGDEKAASRRPFVRSGRWKPP